MSDVFNLNAPIVPGKSAAGVSIGANIEDILLHNKPFTITDLSHEKRYHFGSVSLWVNNEGKVIQIGLYPGYQGKVSEAIGIGSTIGEVITSLGVVIVDEEDNLVVDGSPGWCFDSSRWQSLQSELPDNAASVIDILVFHEDEQRIDSPKYPTTCPQCGREMQFDLILRDRRGVNSVRVSPLPSEDDILGYGRYCRFCQRGWTGDELLRIAKGKGAAST